MNSVLVRWQHDAEAEVVEFDFPLVFLSSTADKDTWKRQMDAHRNRQMELLRVEDRVKYPCDTGIESARTAFLFAICRQDSGRGGWYEVKTPDGERTLFAHPRARAREFGCEWVAPLGPVREVGSSPAPAPKAKPRRQKVVA